MFKMIENLYFSVNNEIIFRNDTLTNHKIKLLCSIPPKECESFKNEHVHVEILKAQGVTAEIVHIFGKQKRNLGFVDQT